MLFPNSDMTDICQLLESNDKPIKNLVVAYDGISIDVAFDDDDVTRHAVNLRQTSHNFDWERLGQAAGRSKKLECIYLGEHSVYIAAQDIAALYNGLKENTSVKSFHIDFFSNQDEDGSGVFRAKQ